MIDKLFDLRGKVALVTGGSKGIGQAMARGLAAAGADIVINSRSLEEMEAAMKVILDGTDRKGHCVVADLFNRDETVSLAREAVDKMGRVDIVVNNAGTNIVNPVDKINDQDWDRLIELNLTAPMVLVRELAGQMKERNWGRGAGPLEDHRQRDRSGTGFHPADRSAGPG
ncbi:MAG: SDR family NAD(P)-dependent oxidoreductase [Desulfofustis sp.]